MKNLGIIFVKFSHKTRKYRSYKGKIGTIAKNLINRRFNTPYPYQKLITDVTEFKTQEGKKLYLSPIMDMTTGEILSYSMSYKSDLNLSWNPCIKSYLFSNKPNIEQPFILIKVGSINIKNGLKH